MMADNHKFLYSIVIAVYNVGNYLEETINSVLEQSIGFKDNIQLILVNDGSTDNSSEVCLKYAKKYPENIFYKQQKNGGVSKARNLGLTIVEGKYVNFLDGDDLLDKDALKYITEFFEQNKENIDLVAIPLKLFGKVTWDHPLQYKFYKTRIVDINKEYNAIQLSSSSAFIKVEAIKGRKFDETLKYAEDAKLLTQIILDKQKYGIVKEAIYHYRKRDDESSATQRGPKDKDWYLDYLDKFSLETLEYTFKKLKNVPDYVQYLVMYDIQWRLNVKDASDVLNEKERELFFIKLKSVLKYISFTMLYSQKKLNIHRRNFLYHLKYDNTHSEEYSLHFTNDDVVLKNHWGSTVCSLKEQKPVIELLYEDKNEIIIAGNLGSYFDKSQFDIVAKLNGQDIKVNEIDRKTHNIYTVNHLVKAYKGFEIRIPFSKVNENSVVELFLSVDNHAVPVELKFEKFSKLNVKKEMNYTALNKHIVSYANGKIRLRRTEKKKVLKLELQYLKQIKLKKMKDIKTFGFRVLWLFMYLFKTKNIWIFMDRQDKADDNAEHLFKYVQSQKNKKIKSYFIIKKGSTDYKRLKKIGKVVPYRSWKHKLLFLLSDKLISSHCDNWVINPFFDRKKVYSNLYTFDFIFLQHGIVKENLSSWLNRYNNDIRRIVASSPLEYNEFFEGDYNFNEENIALTGLARYDNLKKNEDNNSKQILIMPTWRKDLVPPKDQVKGERPYNKAFKHSEYFKRYNNLINNKNLIEAAKKAGYKIMFVPHPDMQTQLKDFDENDYVMFTDYKTSYQSYFNQSNLLITDYSSVFFDFAYMKKPVIYYQFDQGEYHYKAGYFDYDSMGFGKIVKGESDIINSIIEYIKNDCKIEEKYKKRIEKFYKYNDANNSKRIYENIIGI